jgi:hypothetical protein
MMAYMYGVFSQWPTCEVETIKYFCMRIYLTSGRNEVLFCPVRTLNSTKWNYFPTLKNSISIDFLTCKVYSIVENWGISSAG